VRIWLSELEDDLFKPGSRLLLVLRRHAFEDQQEVELTEKIALEANIPPRKRTVIARRLEKRGFLQLRGDGRQQLIVIMNSPPR